MSIECAFVISGGAVSYRHLPPGRSPVYIPDSRDLWEILWDGRASLDGVAHTHPGSGFPLPSGTDVTTFEAVEKGLGKRLKWWILSSTHSVLIEWDKDHPIHPGYDVSSHIWPEDEPFWMAELRNLSYPEVPARDAYEGA